MRSLRERRVISEGWTLWIEKRKPSPECEKLRARVTELGERLEAAEAEHDQPNTIAEVPYEFFRKRARETGLWTGMGIRGGFSERGFDQGNPSVAESWL